MASVGLNKDYHSSPFGMRGGLSAFPVSGVVSGFEVSLAGTNGVDTTPTNAAVTISAGKVRFDGYLRTLAANITGATVATGVDLSANDVTIEIYMNPPRKVVTFTDSEPSGNEGDYALKVHEYETADYGKYDVVNGIYIYKSSAWTLVDPYSEIPYGSGWNNAPFNEIAEAVTSATLSIENEKPIFLGTSLPPHVAGFAQALLRQSAGIKLATIEYVSGAGTIVEGIPEYHLLAV